MKLPIRLLPEAEIDLEEAADYYKSRDRSLGKDFVARVRAVFHRIASQPRLHAQVLGEVRKALVSRFPYVVYYHESEDELLVISVFHTSRDPKEWQRRIA